MSQEIFQAIHENDRDRVAQLINAHPAAACERNEAGVSALMQARYEFRMEIVELLRHAAGELDIFEAATLGDVPRLQTLLRNDPGLAKAFSHDGFTALHLAAFFGQPASVAALLQHAPDINAVSSNQMKVAVINAAAASRNSEVVRLVLQAGANPDTQQHMGYTALHSAAANGNADMVRVLLDAGADPAIRTDAGQTAADMASEKGHSEVAAMLSVK